MAQWIRVENNRVVSTPERLPFEVDGRTDLENQIQEGHVSLTWLLERGWYPVRGEIPELQPGTHLAIEAAEVMGDHVLVRYRLEKDPPPEEISIWQCEQALDDNGLLDQVNAILAQAPEKERRAWSRVTTVRRTAPMIQRFALYLQPPLTDEQVDDLFRYAATLQPD